MPPPTPTPLPQVPTFWEQWSEVLFFLGMVVGSSVWMWTQPASAHFYLLALIGIGCLFDALSLLYYALTFIKRRFHSGLPLVGFAFYFWAWLAYPRPVLLAGGEGFWRITLAKLADLLVLGAAHTLVHLSPAILLRLNKRKIHHSHRTETPDVPPRPCAHGLGSLQANPHRQPHNLGISPSEGRFPVRTTADSPFAFRHFPFSLAQ